MIVVMASRTPLEEIERVIQELRPWKVQAEKLQGKHKVVIGLVGDTNRINPDLIQQISPFIDYPRKTAL